ncbi:MAG: hypothetical protein FJX29_06655 [Alphaproteobacteria bacterium]|nr:hypothetical protein [Alphaproteobacteria bacterium]
MCKGCGKAVCVQCARERRLAITCSPACEEFSEAVNVMNERAMHIYGVGQNKAKGLPTNTVVPGILGLGFIGWAIYDHFWLKSIVAPFFLTMGLVFLFGAWYGWRKYRQHGLNCVSPLTDAHHSDRLAP